MCKLMIMRTFILTCLFFLPAFAFSQDSLNVKGRVTGDSTVLAGATVSLLRGDSGLVKLALSGKEGDFEFNGIAAGEYMISVSSVGYAPYVSGKMNLSADRVIDEIKMIRSNEALSGVTVTAKRPLVEARLDKMIVNVDASPSNAGATALELLEKSPGISVDKDGNISLKGKQGVIVLMDGKQTYLSGQDLANLLRSMPASQLDQVEIMTQPSAKFDAAGNSGIINLRTKKTKTMGFNGSINVGYVQGFYPKSPNSANFNYRKGRVNIFANLGANYWEQFNEQTLLRRFHDGATTTEFYQEGRGHNISNSYNARVGLDFTINPKTTIGFSTSGIYNLRRNSNRSNGIFYQQGAAGIDSSIQAVNTQRTPWKNLTSNINFRRALKKPGQEITADLDYITYRSEMTQFNDNQTHFPSGPSDIFLLRAVLPSDISIYSAKADYVHPLAREAKFEAGVKTSFVRTDNNAPYESFNESSGQWEDDVRKDHFKYDEQISAAYVNFSRQIKKWGVQAGLRAEHTATTGKQVLLGKKISRDYTQLFPTAYISYAMNEKNQFGLNYGRRIERPNYQDLNPFQQFLDKYTYNQGNPFLTPQFTNNVELTHIYKGKLSSTLNYTYTNDIINDILKQDNETKVTYQTKENVAKRRNIGLAVSYNAPITKWWTTSLYANVYNTYFEGIVNGAKLSTDVNSFVANMNQQFRFAKTWGAEVSGFYQSKSLMTSMFIVDPMYVLSFGASKAVMKGKGSIRLSVIDPFKLQKVKVDVQHDNIDMLVKNVWDNRRVGLSFTYRFSKGQAVQQRRRASGAQEEQNRAGGSGNN
ncbi:MAG: TonB-dependent receptor [Chitinophagaceae bacterium]|nr:MAG: TonB-dependent receptor [Chitinophagaceae bacterium]